MRSFIAIYSSSSHHFLLLVDISPKIMIITVIRRFEVLRLLFQTVLIIIIVHHVLHLILDRFPLEMLLRDIIVNMKMMIIHHLSIETVINRVTMTIDRRIIGNCIHQHF